MENSIFKRRLAKEVSRTFAALLLLGGTMGISSCKDDLLTGTPEWLGSSIYEELEERGQFTQTLALINDPDLADAHYPELLRLTGSMTVFVADDAAWQRYLSKRGLTSVSQLSLAEKRRLLKAAMINSAYLIELLDNENNGSTEPFEGRTMRRDSRMELDDSITLLSNADMPAVNPYRLDNNGQVIDYWSDVRSKPFIKIYQDASVAPMVHFLPGFMAQTGMTNEDLAVISNGASRSINRSYINGHAISLNKGTWSKDAGKTYLQDITCQNGYIHILDEVPEPLPNMAEIIRQKPQFSIFSELLERFSYPQIYNTITNPDGSRDVYYTKRYFNASLNHGLEQYTKEDGTPVTVNNRLGTASSSKGFDPGWNQYALYTDPATPMGRDAAAMFVPTNEWMEQYLYNDGSAIGAKYDYDWSKVPDNLVIPLLDNCMQTSFRSTIPSKFAGVKNTASDNMGITMDDVDSCFLACNGAVYELTKVFAAPKHQSVGFPASLFADETDENKKLTIASRIQDYEPPMYNPGTTTEHNYHKAWRVNEFNAYLNSMSSTYSYMLAIDNAYGYYIDPYSFISGEKKAAFRFYIPTGNSDLPMRAEAFQLDENMQVTDVRLTAPSLEVVANRLYDLMDNSIIVHGQRPSTPIHAGQEVYLTKAGGAIKVQFSGNTVTGIAGSYQAEKGEFIAVTPELTFDMTDKGNGVTYILGALPQSTLTSPYQLMTNVEAHPEFSSFAKLLKEASFVETQEQMDGHKTIGNPITLFGNYHYTVYIPENTEIDALIAAGKLPSADQRKEWETFKTALDDYVTKELDLLPEDQKEIRSAEIDALTELADTRLQTMQDVIDNFLRFHFQDGSLFIGGADTAGVFETSSLDLKLNRFRRLNVTVNHNSGTFRVQAQGSGVVANVIDDGMNSNLMSRQYLFSSNKTIFSSSYVVTHLIDKALFYDESQFLPTDFPSPEYPEWLPIPTEPEPGLDGSAGPAPIRKKHPSQMIPLKHYNR